MHKQAGLPKILANRSPDLILLKLAPQSSGRNDPKITKPDRATNPKRYKLVYACYAFVCGNVRVRLRSCTLTLVYVRLPVPSFTSTFCYVYVLLRLRSFTCAIVYVYVSLRWRSYTFTLALRSCTSTCTYVNIRLRLRVLTFASVCFTFTFVCFRLRYFCVRVRSFACTFVYAYVRLRLGLSYIRLRVQSFA